MTCCHDRENMDEVNRRLDKWKTAFEIGEIKTESIEHKFKSEGLKNKVNSENMLLI